MGPAMVMSGTFSQCFHLPASQSLENTDQIYSALSDGTGLDHREVFVTVGIATTDPSPFQHHEQLDSYIRKKTG